MAAVNLVRVRRLTRQALRLGYTNITNTGDGSVVDLNAPAVARDFYRFAGRFVVIGPAESGYADGTTNMDPNEAISDLTALATQKTIFTSLELGKGVVVNGLTYYSGTTPAGTPTYQKAGIYTSDGTTLTLVASSTDLTTTAWAADSAQAFSGGTFPYTTPSAATYVFALHVLATTPPSLTGRLPKSAAIANLNAAKQFGILTGTSATIPASQALSGVTADNRIPLITLT